MQAYLHLLFSILLFGLCQGEEKELHAPAHGKLAEEAPLASPGKTFSIVPLGSEWPKSAAAKVVFRDTSLAEVPLEALDWRGLYYISPDDRWILRVQKTGSGDNEAILYSVGKDGKVSAIKDFNETLWNSSGAGDWHNFYHCGVSEVKWSADSKSIRISLRGKTDTEQSFSCRGILTLENFAYRVLETRTEKPLPFSSDE